jgi:hypothetical protein
MDKIKTVGSTYMAAGKLDLQIPGFFLQVNYPLIH